MISKLATGLILVVLGVFIYAETTNMKNDYKVNLGVYDPAGTYNTVPYVTIASEYFSWTDAAALFSKFLEKAASLQRTPLITVEPWSSSNHSVNTDTLLEDIVEGKYDIATKSICSELLNFEGEVLIRWGHEMELTNERYPWSGKDGEKYISAYKHFVDICRTAPNNNFKFVWSPAGEDTLTRYWPGADYVDVIGLSVYSFDTWEKNTYGYQRDLINIFSQRYQRVKHYKKPILIAEMGYTGSETAKRKQIEKFAKELKNYPLLESVVYFNSQDVDGVWGKDIKTPSWNITPEALSPLYELTEVFDTLEK